MNVSATAQDAWHPMGKHASIGVIFGTNMTGDIATRSQTFGFAEGTVTSTISSGSRRLIVGPSVELYLPRRLSVEIDALYRPVSLRTKIVSSNVTGVVVIPSSFGDSTAVTWEFPVLLKQRFTWGRTAPFIGGGPSFRRPQSLSFSSPYGAVAGAGIDIPWGHLHIAPIVRYTRWASGRVAGFEEMRLNQSEVLVGVSF